MQTPVPMFSSTLLSQLDALSRGGLRQNIPLARYTTLRIGGPATLLMIINQTAHLEMALMLLHQHQTPFFLLGGGSNVLISDTGIPGLTILNQCKDIVWHDDSEQDEVMVDAASGAALAGLAREAIRRGLAGISWAVSIPGTVGGAVVGNAGAHGGDIASIFESARIWRRGQIQTWQAEEMRFTYRSSLLKNIATKTGHHPVILSTRFHLKRDSQGEAAARANAYVRHRRRTQPTDKSAGSIFKNPPGDYAGRLLEISGLKGYCVGDACVSEKHANFIINRGQATAADVVTLMSRMRQEVWRQHKVLLEPEILFVGDWQKGPSLATPDLTTA